jgi:superfamily II DNA or RNA helicase/HKD family nuclease
MPLPRGLYEALLTTALDTELQTTDDASPLTEPLRNADAANRLAWHLGRIIERTIQTLPKKDRVPLALSLADALVDVLAERAPNAEPQRDRPRDHVLAAIRRRLPDGRFETLDRPLTPLLDTTLLTNARGEPALTHEISSEIASADRIDVLMAFVRVTGIAPLKSRLAAHCKAGRPLRILTTTYTGSTEAKALQTLVDLGADVRVSYDTSTTRLHAKAWHFHRDSGFSTAYIGSSNLTHSAQVAGLEWNVRVSGQRNPTVVERIEAVFETYYNGGDFVPFDAAEFAEQTSRAHKGSTTILTPIEVRPYPFQERLLEELAIARSRGHHRNLLVAATGTGKTVMAAVDYARLRSTLPRDRLLFVAHRQEILEQSLSTFRHTVRQGDFGELWVGGKRPETFDHVFASVQSLRAAGFDHLPADHFDVVIVDEFHHAAAKSYADLLRHIKPRELLGLTATPERADGLPILDWFEGRIAAELRLWDAIDQQRLSPFSYYGIHDGLDLRDVPWKRGRGYDVEGLTNLLTANEIWARKVIHSLDEHVADPHAIRALGFCVSVAHARFMARVFQDAGIAAIAVSGETPEPERKAALRDLAKGEVNVVFSVDLFNEGIDVPRVDTLLLLRPTDSATLFLQQLGRGLRRHEGKGACVVLDFVGHHRREFRFDRKLRALLGGTRKELERQVEQGFPFLPSGCHMQLDRVAQSIVLDNIKSSLPSQWKGKVEELRAYGKDLPLGTFLDESGFELDDIYAGGRSWSQLRQDAALPVAPPGSNEDQLRRSVGRLLHLDDPLRIDLYRQLLTRDAPPPLAELHERQRRLLAMLTAGMFIKSKVATKDHSLRDGLDILWRHPQVRAELVDLLDVLEDRISHQGAPLDALPDVPLRIHARYSRAEIIAAFTKAESATVFSWQTGAYWKKDANVHLLPFTLDKTGGAFSPTTRYRDYAISRRLIHWESQATTRADSPTGLSYQQHQQHGTQVMLFARLNDTTKTYFFLGPAHYQRHQSERPMQIVWNLQHELPGDLFAEFAAAVG